MWREKCDKNEEIRIRRVRCVCECVCGRTERRHSLYAHADWSESEYWLKLKVGSMRIRSAAWTGEEEGGPSLALYAHADWQKRQCDECARSEGASLLGLRNTRTPPSVSLSLATREGASRIEIPACFRFRLNQDAPERPLGKRIKKKMNAPHAPRGSVSGQKERYVHTPSLLSLGGANEIVTPHCLSPSAVKKIVRCECERRFRSAVRNDIKGDSADLLVFIMSTSMKVCVCVCS